MTYSSIPLTFSLFLDDEEYLIEGDYFPGDPGQTSGPVEACHPPEDSEFEITLVIKEGEPQYILSQETIDRLIPAAEEAADKAYEILCDKTLAEEAEYWENERQAAWEDE